MMGYDRIGSAIAVAAIHALIGYALFSGLHVSLRRSAKDLTPLAVFYLPPPPPEPVSRPPPPSGQAGGAPAPETRPQPQVATPAPAPPALLHLPAPRPIVPPPIMARGNAAGQGTSGSGAGQGSGGLGQGEGAGAGDGRGFSEARQIRGRFRNSDFPDSAKGAGRLKTGVRYAVGPSGRVDQCEIIEPSGYPEVDAMTCRVIIDRYRFKPARDEQGTPITEVMEEDYSWTWTGSDLSRR
ncbi:MAG TPA: energy transducer TonB [Sphingobium sp.]|nr:energy transducer TonB [Sphingobium sp.]